MNWPGLRLESYNRRVRTAMHLCVGQELTDLVIDQLDSMNCVEIALMEGCLEYWSE